MTIPQVLTSLSLCSVVFGFGLILPSRSTAMPELHQPNLLLAQNYSSGCRDGESLFVETETRDYWIYICGGDNPGTYVGIEKQNPRHSIRLPLTDYDPQGNYFEAVNGDVVYILAKTPRGMFLTVTQGSQELLRQYVLQPW
jgi:hypothetical protein